VHHARTACVIALACAGCQDRMACEAELTEAGSVARVRWHDPRGGAWRVEYGPGDTPTLSTPEIRPPGDDDGEALLLGTAPLEDVGWRVVRDDGRAFCEGSIRTGNLPTALPDVEATPEGPGASTSPFWLVTTVGEHASVLLLDREGRTLWGRPWSIEQLAIDAQLRPGDGAEATILANIADPDREDGATLLIELGFDGVERQSWSAPDGHHVFAQVPGRVAYLARDARPSIDPVTDQPATIAGDAIAEVDLVSGAVRRISSTWEWLPVEPHDRWDDAFYGETIDWTHANGLKHDAATDTYLLTLANPALVAEIDAATGMPLRTFGPGGAFRPADEGSGWRWPHDASFTPEGHLLAFATHATNDTRGALELEVGADGHLHAVWSHGFTEDVPGHALGQAIRLDSGNTLVNFGDGGVLREVTPDGEVVWEVEAPLGTWFGQVHAVRDLYEAG
jgi:hypothetical protein